MEKKYMLIRTDGYSLNCVGKFALKEKAELAMEEDWKATIEGMLSGDCFVIPGRSRCSFEDDEAVVACDGVVSELVLWKIFSV